MVWTFVIDEAALPEGIIAPVYPAGVNVVIARVDGAVYALSGRCAHMSCPLSLGTVNGHTLMCSCHDWRFDVRCARAYYYAYFDGVDESRLGDEVITEFESGPGAGNIVCRCENGRTVAATAFDAAELHAARRHLRVERLPVDALELQLARLLAVVARSTRALRQRRARRVCPHRRGARPR